MFELFFIIILPDGAIMEQWPNVYTSKEYCVSQGWEKASELKSEIIARYPELQNFGIECVASEKTFASND